MLSRWIDYPGPLWKAYSIFAIFLVVLSLLVNGVIMCSLMLLPIPRRYPYFFGRLWNRSTLFFYRIRLRVRGAENFDPKIACLIATNHQSLLDIPSAMEVFSGKIRMVAKKELFRIPIFGQLIYLAGMIPVDRGNRKSGHKVSQTMERAFKNGDFIWVAPEGTRSPTQELLPFKKGSFATALQVHVPIQPFVLFNSYRACPKGELLVRPGTVIDCEILPRFDTSKYQIEDRARVAHEVRERMQERMRAFTGSRTPTFDKG